MIAEYIMDEILLPRLGAAGCLVVYDAAGIYRELCTAMASPKIEVVDAAASGIESREACLRGLSRLCSTDGGLEGFIIYVPTERSLSDEDLQSDPFSLYARCGAVFPEGAADDLEQICLRAKPSHATEIRRLFAGGSRPSFGAIDAVGIGIGWPRLRAMLGAEAPGAILFSLLCPNEVQRKALESDDQWIPECWAFLSSTIGFELKIANPLLGNISEETWRFALFSEFAFGLPEGDMPSNLGSVPHAPVEARIFVEELCERLRHDLRSRTIYIERATQVEAELKLVETVGGLVSLGQRDTFPFAERAAIRVAVEALLAGETDKAKGIVHRHAASVWLDIWREPYSMVDHRGGAQTP